MGTPEYKLDFEETPLERDIRLLIRSLHQDGKLQRDKARKLVEIGEPAVLPLLAALNDPNTTRRGTLIELLGEIKDARAIEPLLAIFNNPDEDTLSVGVASLAAVALGKIAGPAIVESLLNRLGKSSHALNYAIIDVLVDLQDKRAIKPLQTLFYKRFYTREISRVLVRLGDECVFDFLREDFKQFDWGTRMETVMYLGLLKHPYTLRFLEYVEKEDEDAGIRNMATDALAIFSNKQFLEDLGAEILKNAPEPL